MVLNLIHGVGGSSPRLWGTFGYFKPAIMRRRFIPTPVGNMREVKKKRYSLSVHPHACGEHPCRGHFSSPTSGSSPRLWGTSCALRAGFFARRFIPTPVGNIASMMPISSLFPVHPHACGEHARCMAHLSRNAGSSPRLWGTLVRGISKQEIERFIPTPVGNIYVRIA